MTDIDPPPLVRRDDRCQAGYFEVSASDPRGGEAYGCDRVVGHPGPHRCAVDAHTIVEWANDHATDPDAQALLRCAEISAAYDQLRREHAALAESTAELVAAAVKDVNAKYSALEHEFELYRNAAEEFVQFRDAARGAFDIFEDLVSSRWRKHDEAEQRRAEERNEPHAFRGGGPDCMLCMEGRQHYVHTDRSTEYDEEVDR